MRIKTFSTRGFTAALLALASSSSIAAAQERASKRFWVRPFGGMFLPTGSHKSTLKSGMAVGVQGSYSFNRYIAAVGTFAWAGSKEDTSTKPEVDVFQYDIGAETGFDKQLTSALAIRPFFGLGMGGRAYDYDDIASESQYNIAGYGSTGAVLSMGRFAWRLEVRDYVTGYQGLSGELDSRQTRNDLMVSSGFLIRF
jgi:hypothetical protein